MAHTRNEVLTAAKSAFPGVDAAEIVAVLDRYGITAGERERERVQLTIIALSDGDRGKLERLVEEAKGDYRDILAMQQLGPILEAEGKKLQDEARVLIEKWGEK